MVRKLIILSILFMLAAILLTSCSTPKTVVEHHHHYQEVDTQAVCAIVDRHMGGWHEEMEQAISVAIQSQQTEMTSDEQQKERITETITTWVDSLGRTMRQEQRTTERDISKLQRLLEQRIATQYEQRLMQVTDSLNEAWQAKFEESYTHWAEMDSTYQSAIPAAEDNRPWWKKAQETLTFIMAGIAFGAVMMLIWKR